MNLANDNGERELPIERKTFDNDKQQQQQRTEGEVVKSMKKMKYYDKITNNNTMKTTRKRRFTMSASASSLSEIEAVSEASTEIIMTTTSRTTTRRPTIHRQQQHVIPRHLDYNFDQYVFWDNNSSSSCTNCTDFDSNLQPAEDVSVDAVVTSIYFNTIVFIVLMLTYEGMRRLLPTVYSRRKRIDVISGHSNSTGSTLHKKVQHHHHGDEGSDGIISIGGGKGGEGNDSDGSTTSSSSEAEVDQDDSSSVLHRDPLSTSPPPPSLHRVYPAGGVDNNNLNNNSNYSAPSVASGETIPYPSLSNMESNDGAIGQQEKLFSEQTMGMASLPDDRPLDWIRPVVGVPWSKVRRIAGLDGYFFLRYIRMNVRITAVSCFWFFLVLVPVYATGGNPMHTAHGWYHISAVNIAATGWRMWVPVFSSYLFSAFIVFVIKQEYKHFLELRQDFLARGSAHVHPQHHYSLMVESIPYELRSDRALYDYFDGLFPGRVHSSSIVMKASDLEEASMRCNRICHRLEKSIAHLHAKGTRPSHVVGRGRLKIMGVELPPLDCSEAISCLPSENDSVQMDYQDANTTNTNAERPPRGTRVDSISYYTLELAQHSRALLKMQKRKYIIAEEGNQSVQAQNWLDQVVRDVGIVASQIMDDSMQDNALILHKTWDDNGDNNSNGTNNNNKNNEYDPRASYPTIPQAERMTSKYGSFSPATLETYSTKQQRQRRKQKSSSAIASSLSEDKTTRLITSDHQQHQQTRGRGGGVRSSPLQVRFEQGENDNNNEQVTADDISESLYPTPFGQNSYHSTLRRWGGRLGLDFLVAGLRFINGQVDVTLEGVIGTTMSSTGFVTFLDLASTTCAVSAPLTVKSHLLKVSVAPEPREIQWQNAHVSQRTKSRREVTSNFVLFVGIILWSFPLAAIQAFAKAEYLAKIPGMEWILTFHGGKLTKFVNGYLPVVALLGLIVILPVIFEQIAVHYEGRKTFSDIQASMLTRYFYYMLANIYVSVTAGSILKSLADILDHPSNVLDLLSESLPTMVGYFIALLVTKIMAGLPMIFLRFGALSRMVLLRTLSSPKKLTQRELDWVYRLENVQYGWEFPTQLLVVVIVFTYAIMCPVILPFGLLYFTGALVVYKKQILYVYSPVYESGGTMFPLAVQRSLFGLVCGQLTFLGYLFTRGSQYQPIAMLPLPIITIWVTQHFHEAYVVPSTKLSLERAREYDIKTNAQAERTEQFDDDVPKSEYGIESRRRTFDKNSYRQPVLTQLPTKPWMYRRGQKDEETVLVRRQLRRIGRLSRADRNSRVSVHENQQQAPNVFVV